MTNGNSERLGKASGLPRLLALLVGLLAALALIVSGAAPASAQNVVGPQPQNSILAVGPHQAAAQTIVGVRGPPQLRHVSATGVAAETASSAGDHIVLGIDDEGLQSTASKVGGRTLMNDANWRNTLQNAIGDPSARFTVSLDGFSGSSTTSQVMGAASRGAGAAGK